MHFSSELKTPKYYCSLILRLQSFFICLCDGVDILKKLIKINIKLFTEKCINYINIYIYLKIINLN